MEKPVGPSFVHVDDGSAEALRISRMTFALASAECLRQMEAAQIVASVHGQSNVDSRIVEVLREVAAAETTDDFGEAQEHARAILRGGVTKS
jgi:hypothetical protein